MSFLSKTRSAAAAAGLLFAGSVQAGTLLDATNVFSLQGTSPGVALFDGADLTPKSGFSTAFKADGLAYQAGTVFVSGVETDGFLTGSYLRSYNLAGDPLDFAYGASFVSWGPLATGNGALYAGTSVFTLSGADYSIRGYNHDLTSTGFLIDLPEEPTALAFGDSSLFVSYGSTIARYDLMGGLMDAHDYVFFDVTALTYGAGTLFAGFTDGSDHGFGLINPDALVYAAGDSVGLGAPVRGLAFGDGGLFVSTQFTLAKYDADGDQLHFLDSTPVVSHGPLAFIPGGSRPRDPAGAVPEPQAWALMILGFGAAGATLRLRNFRRTAAS